MRRRMTVWSMTPLIFMTLALVIGQQAVDNFNTELAEQDDTLLLLSTLGGLLVGVDKRSGKIRWQQDDEPVVKVPVNLAGSKMPMFLPDPRDGSLYLFGRESEALKKLPFTIPQLVASSPCRSSDGILYTGRKIDTWFSIDPTTGEREQLLSFYKVKDTCPLEMQNTIFVGRTEYNIIMVDSKRKDRKWNVTFYDYSAMQMKPDVTDNYDLVHFTTSSTGRVVTVDRRLGRILWKLDLKSPVIAMYTVTKDGLLTVPFKSIADSLLEKFATRPTDIEWFPTLYIGQHRYGLYALPSLVDSDTTIISSNIGHLLLEGPLLTSHPYRDDKNVPLPGDHVFISNIDVTDDGYQSIRRTENAIVLGHYEVPTEYKPQSQLLQITGRSDPIILETVALNVTGTKLSVAVQSDTSNGTMQLEENRNWQRIISKTYNASKTWLNRQENVDAKLIVIPIILTIGTIVAWYLYKQRKDQFQYMSQASRESSRTNYSGKSGNNSVVIQQEIGDGLVIKVGKVTFDTRQVLGKGCDGTLVYKGEFDGRAIAVKRLLPDCFTLADREVALLRESDAHANVVRYFCTEQDRMFRYIALELAEATLQDYVTGKYDRGKISVKNILHQATSGLAHLHFLDIVHRDIKPHNVLLSVPGPRGEVRAMISDFGLCKKLQLGRVSFSRRSGITGTDGWIAPEMLNGERTTCAVDIFSLGCVFYYVLSNGKHPFGDPLRRQANILCGESNLTSLEKVPPSDRELALLLIKAMICGNPAARPPASAICNYPFFWNLAEILGFFQDISDRVEKDQSNSPALIALETCGERVTGDDWRLYIDLEVATDLRKYRSYRGESVRDLLRALRNKKHHYRELSPKAQESLGEIPNEFTEYWLSRFPCLLCHVWCAMQNFRDESSLKQYYHPHYTFASGYEGQQAIVRTNNALSTSARMGQTDRVDWSPNRTKNRVQRRKQEKKKQEQPATWLLHQLN
ncbi:PREDICTED: serine/threonine-protein kinase/endoribonuclease IRE1-like [Vollenhovia emeryi]|uniref:serine/threonine-protein kinase/endoribonuclease IRE1-like n=1 Tax=Vollenhovia emeryi TaxID=411798 RepID=UPI0005F4AF44|nr:PREDICTED: serine/threonine-protein kinase/endoribonuclease IRE1-like [Vollenhovia emeryi]